MSDINRLQEAYEKPGLDPRAQYQIGMQLDILKYRMNDAQLNRQKEIESDFRRRVLRVMQPRH